mmetsp:Transcript_52015/g.90797  ORF Transcript_52015/g.90797 Transcript_52015/m.90797 type:complete len:410 (+) Transcript_52015:1070-2299(+)
MEKSSRRRSLSGTGSTDASAQRSSSASGIISSNSSLMFTFGTSSPSSWHGAASAATNGVSDSAVPSSVLTLSLWSATTRRGSIVTSAFISLSKTLASLSSISSDTTSVEATAPRSLCTATCVEVDLEASTEASSHKPSTPSEATADCSAALTRIVGEQLASVRRPKSSSTPSLADTALSSTGRGTGDTDTGISVMIDWSSTAPAMGTIERSAQSSSSSRTLATSVGRDAAVTSECVSKQSLDRETDSEGVSGRSVKIDRSSCEGTTSRTDALSVPSRSISAPLPPLRLTSCSDEAPVGELITETSLVYARGEPGLDSGMSVIIDCSSKESTTGTIDASTQSSSALSVATPTTSLLPAEGASLGSREDRRCRSFLVSTPRSTGPSVSSESCWLSNSSSSSPNNAAAGRVL